MYLNILLTQIVYIYHHWEKPVEHTGEIPVVIWASENGSSVSLIEILWTDTIQNLISNKLTTFDALSFTAQDARTVDITAYDATDHNVRTERSTVTSSSATLPPDMARRKPENEATSAYMPGMTQKKKKKGIFGLFSKRKEGKFKLVRAIFNVVTCLNSTLRTYMRYN